MIQFALVTANMRTLLIMKEMSQTGDDLIFTYGDVAVTVTRRIQSHADSIVSVRSRRLWLVFSRMNAHCTVYSVHYPAVQCSVYSHDDVHSPADYEVTVR